MELTGKAKIEFEKWFSGYCKTHLKEEREDFPNDEDLLESFNENLLDSMKYGVMVDFFDSVEIDIDKIFEGCMFESFLHNNGEGDASYHRPLARTAAIEKANQIFNER